MKKLLTKLLLLCTMSLCALGVSVAMIVLAGCTDEQFDGTQSYNSGTLKAIQMSNASKAVTRADKTGEDAAGTLNNNFIVEGFKSNGTLADAVEVFKYYSVNYYPGTANSTESNSKNWEYVGQKTINSTDGKIDVYTSENPEVGISPIPVQSIKYWDPDYSQYDFVAFSQGLGTGEIDSKTYARISEVNRGNIGSAVNPVYNIKGNIAELGAAYIADLVTEYRETDKYQNMGPVTPKFRNVSAKIRMAIYEKVPGYSVKDVRFYQSASEVAKTKTTVSDLSETPTLLSVSAADYVTPDAAVSTGSGTMSVYFPITGSSNVGKENYNRAVLKFFPDDISSEGSNMLTFNELKYGSKEKSEANENIYLGRTSNSATYAGEKDVTDYVGVIPTGEGHVLKLRVAYTLVATDGGEDVIVMEDAAAIVPARFADWQPNYAYTYIFKISEKTGDGLYPITFDALVMDSDDGIQETITEVSNPSITTYQKGKVVTENDEYLVEEPIFVVADDGKALSTTEEGVGYVRLFAAGLIPGEAGERNAQSALQNITEATAENCFEKGIYDENGKTWTVTDAAGAKLVLTDVTENLTIATQIPAQYTTDSLVWNINNAQFTPIESGYYVFQYEWQAAGPVYYEDVEDYNNDKSTWITEEEFDALPDAEKLKIPAQPVRYVYKVIKVAEGSGPSRFVGDTQQYIDGGRLF
ncbi:MAG: hypothetical protein MJY81_07880 [Bacteroidaceae bacterium]|nr:hypothetical protein [Bacteroidaceae bacterium]